MEHHDPFVENPHRWDTAYGLVAVRSSGYFVWIDVALSWILYGVVFVQMCNYFHLLRTKAGRGRENGCQVSAIAVVWTLLTAAVLVNLDRSIKLNATHFGEVDYNNHFKRRPHNATEFAFCIPTLAIIQILIIHRSVAFARLLTGGRLGTIREAIKWIGSAVFLLWGTSAGLSEYYLYQFDSYAELIEQVTNPGGGMPRFLIFQITWLSSGLAIALLISSGICRDLIQARRYNSTNHPNVELTNEVLYQLLSAVVCNWMLICAAHAAYILATFYDRSAIAGRGTACLAPIYAFSLMRMISAPRETRLRQLMESENQDLPQHYDPPGRKRLFGLGRFGKKAKSARTAAGASSLATTGGDLGFFSMLRGPDEGRTSSSTGGRASAAASRARRRGSRLADGIAKRTEVFSYSRREKEFYLLEERVDAQVEQPEEQWARKNQLLGIGNAVWVETETHRRPLSANEHYPTPQLSTSPSLSPSVPSPGRSLRRITTASPSSAPGSRARSSRLGTLSAPAFAPVRSDRAPGHTHLGERRAQVAFLDSFPSAPVVSHSYGTYDPDLDDFELPTLSLQPVPEPS